MGFFFLFSGFRLTFYNIFLRTLRNWYYQNCKGHNQMICHRFVNENTDLHDFGINLKGFVWAFITYKLNILVLVLCYTSKFWWLSLSSLFKEAICGYCKIRSGPVNVRYIGASYGCLRVGPGQGKFHQDILKSGLKIKVWLGGLGSGC